MINVATITEVLRAQLAADVDVAALVAGIQQIDRGEYINTQPDRTPWIGVYRGAVKYDPRTLGRGTENWQGLVTIRVIVQEATTDSGRRCEDLLEGHVQKVLTAILSDKQLSNNVDMLTGMDVAYSYNETDRETVFFQNATITLTYEVSTT